MNFIRRIITMFKTINKPQSLTMYDIAISQRIKDDNKIKIGKVSILQSIDFKKESSSKKDRK